jgi:D-alanyl-lipoteichoic acid acyltransferase DltB (MBOAT superfamily)
MGGPVIDKDRIQKPAFYEDYNYVNFLAYILYTPLYLCGPIITFNDFVSQVRTRSEILLLSDFFFFFFGTNIDL